VGQENLDYGKGYFVFILIYLVFVAAIFYWQMKLVMAGKKSKGKAIMSHLAYTIAPIILYGAVFLALVGIEELADTTIIGEGYARTLPFIIIGGLSMTLLGTFIFSLVVIFTKQPNTNAT